jgi:hypothetical protein
LEHIDVGDGIVYLNGEVVDLLLEELNDGVALND